MNIRPLHKNILKENYGIYNNYIILVVVGDVEVVVSEVVDVVVLVVVVIFFGNFNQSISTIASTIPLSTKPRIKVMIGNNFVDGDMLC